MTIKELKTLNFIDENTKVAIISGDVNKPHLHYAGHFVDMPEILNNSQLEEYGIAPMGERRKNNLGLNTKTDWLEMWIEE